MDTRARWSVVEQRPHAKAQPNFLLIDWEADAGEQHVATFHSAYYAHGVAGLMNEHPESCPGGPF